MSFLHRSLRCLSLMLLAGSALLNPMVSRGAEPAAVEKMVDPAIDATGPFCYLAYPNFNIGVMGVGKGSQVTFDGAIFAGGNEVAFFTGADHQPVMARQKLLLDDWLPVIRWGVKNAGVAYEFEAFAAPHDDNPLSNTTNFIRVTARNENDTPTRGMVTVANRFAVDDHRFGYMRQYPFSPSWKYEMLDDAMVRDGKIILLFPAGGTREAVAGKPYESPFSGADFHVSDRTEVGLITYDSMLEPGEKKTIEFKMPSFPVAADDAVQLAAIRESDYETKRRDTVATWRNLEDQGARLYVPEEKVAHAHRASLMYNWIAIWTSKVGDWAQGVNKTQYNWFWLRDGAWIVRNYDLWGFHQVAAKCLDHHLTFQKDNGNFQSQEGQTDGFGQTLYVLGQHALLTGDKAFARDMIPRFEKAIEWLKGARAEDPDHIMPATNMLDNEYVHGHLPGHNFWALAGVRTAVRTAMLVGDKKNTAAWRAEFDDFHRAFMEKLVKECGTDRPIPPSFETTGGQDWGNLLALFPSEALGPDDARVAATMKKMRAEKYAEGLMTYKGQLHHYVTVKATHNFLVRNEQEEVLRDFYAILLHMGSCHEMFEWETAPWGARDTGRNLPPHGWGSAMFNTLLRNMLVMERGGDGGLDGREIWLFNAVSPTWAKAGQRVAFERMPTEMGPVSAEMRFEEDGASVRIEASWRTWPTQLVLPIPYWAELESFQSDARQSRHEGDFIYLTPDASRVSLKWKLRNEIEPLSFVRAVELFKDEYARKFAEYRAAGHEASPVVAPTMQTAEEREKRWREVFSPAATGMAVGKTVEASTGKDTASRAVDGNAVDPQRSSWVTKKADWPATLKIDLGAETTVTRVQVVPDYLSEQTFRYKVETSVDGEKWGVIGDMRENKVRATDKGDLFEVKEPAAVRFVLLTQEGVAWGESAGFTEVRVFGK
ncbi:hypothetical protein CVU37_09900 [candidate division BRC1 bacterium HGW-BRC1-1]|nr:MAG: hypothetical protein CVU37_09900 [candidate division BRC1 bacterium HGW-BRC1-1]